jgi:hypothetical protein
MNLEMTLRRTLLPSALVAAALLPGCNSSTPTVPTGVTAAGLTIKVEPTPVVASQNPVTLVSTAGYKIVLTETNGLGGQLQFVNGSVYGPTTGKLVALNYFDSKDLVVFVGKDRIEPGGTLTITQSANYTLDENQDGVLDASKAALLTVSVQLKDDRGNLINVSSLVNIQ